MHPEQAGGDEAQQRLFEQLADYIETLDRGGGIDQDTVLAADPAVQAGVREYLDAVAAVDCVAGPLRALATAWRPADLPRLVGDYELLEEIGGGGTAIVYRARQRGLNRFVAVKMLRGGRPGSLHDVERMRLEAEAVARLEHPGIVPIYEVGEHEGRPFFSMQLFERGSLARRLAEFRDRPRQAAELVAAVADAVHHAHQRGILHRDLKPSNILLDAEGRPHVADFGLAKQLESDQELTRTGELIGTPAYIAPERVAGTPWAGAATVVSDVYGLGGILYALLCGRPPFAGATPVQTLLSVSTEDPAAISSLNAAVPRDLETICLKCLQKDPARRYATARDVADDLGRWLSGEPISARQVGWLERARRWSRRHPVRATAGAAACVLAVAGVIGLVAGYVLVSRANRVAEAHRTAAEQKATELGHRLYATRMSQGHQHLQRGELRELRALLDEFSDQPDRRGFEWRWLDRYAQSMPRESAHLTGHAHIVYGGAISPDGGTVATCGADATIRLWDSATGNLKQVLDCGDGLSLLGAPLDENCVGFSPDGLRLASVSESGAVRIWTLADRSRRELSPAPSAETLSVEFSRDGRWLVTASVDGVVRVWDADRHELVRELTRHAVPAKWAVFSPDAAHVASIDQDGTVIVTDRASGTVLVSFHTGVRSYCLAWSPAGDLLATEGPQDLVCLWNAATGQRVGAMRARWGVRSLDFSPEGARLAGVGNDGCVRIWSIPGGRELHYFHAHTETVWTVRFAPGGDRLLTCGGDRLASVWDVDPGPELEPPSGFPHPVRQLAFAPAGDALAVLTTEEQLWLGDVNDPAGWEQVPGVYRAHVPPVFSPDGGELACIGEHGEVLRWNIPLREWQQPFLPTGLAELDYGWKRGATPLAYLDNHRLFALTSRGALWECSAGTWREVRPAREGVGHARLLAPLADPHMLALCDLEPERIEFWNVDRGTCDRAFDCGAKVYAGAISRDGRWLACGFADGAIRLVTAGSPAASRVLIGHRRQVNALAFSPDGRTLASASEDGTARLWNVATGLELFVIEHRTRNVFSLAFSPGGDLLAIGGEPRDDGATLCLYRGVAP